MSHSRGKDKTQPGKFAFQCWDWNGAIFRAQGGFATAQEADRVAEAAEREMTMIAMHGAPIENTMTDDELLAELLA